MAAFEAWLYSLILVVNVVNVGELQRKRTLAASRGFLAAARLSCSTTGYTYNRYAKLDGKIGAPFLSCMQRKDFPKISKKLCVSACEIYLTI